MPDTYLTERDVQNYGSDLIDLTQRAAFDAVAPHLQHLQETNAELQRRLAIEARHRLDAQVAAAVPDFEKIDRMPEWHSWLKQTNPLSGQVRQTELNDAINSGSAARCAAFFREFQREHGGNQQRPARHRETAGSRARTHDSKPTYTPDDIKRNYQAKMKGAFAGREDEWNALEADMIAAGREGRILMAPYLTK